MTKTQLSERSGVSRATIDRWKTGTRGRDPQAPSVNAVADVLGIPRERALRLAGIIAAESGQPAPVPPELAGMPELVESVRRRFPDPATQARVLEAMAAAARGEPPSGPGAAGPPRGERKAG